eukprot:Lithocolla_globosa_v1_NODE_5618_length_1209_cov_37.867418.p1 type:complete len:334 gc:universal NODE_5618_length_1209_cov_37.867418:51-1052(+)
MTDAPSNSNLIVNYLPAGVTDDSLREIFAPYGNILSTKVIIEKGTNKSLGFGFVKFESDADASRATDALNRTQLEGKTLKVAIAKPQGMGETNVYVAGLEPQYTKDDLLTVFQIYGKVQEARVLTDKHTGSSRGVGFVRYETHTEAKVAIQALNGVTLAGTSKPLTVRIAEKKDKTAGFMAPGMTAAHMRAGALRFNPMGYGGFGADPMAMRQYAQQTQAVQPGFYSVGSVVTGVVPGAGGQGYASVPGHCVFAYNLPPDTDEAYLYQLFGPFGAIASVRVIRDKQTQQCKGFGFVNYVKQEDAQSSIAALNGAQIGTKTLQVSFKKQGQERM